MSAKLLSPNPNDSLFKETFQDTLREKAPSNKTPALTKCMNMNFSGS